VLLQIYVVCLRWGFGLKVRGEKSLDDEGSYGGRGDDFLAAIGLSALHLSESHHSSGEENKMLAVIVAALTILIVAIAVYTDVRWGKIFNAVTLPGMIIGLAVNGALGGVEGLWLSFQGLLLGFALFLVSAFFGRILGGGDIKLLMAIGALQGPVFLIWALFYTAIIGAVLAIALGLYRGVLAKSLRSLVASCYLRLAQRVPMELNEATGGPRLPYAIAISLGSLVALGVFGVFHP